MSEKGNGEKKALWWAIGLLVPALMGGYAWAVADARETALAAKDRSVALEARVDGLQGDVKEIKRLVNERKAKDEESRALLRAMAKKLRVEIPDKE